MTSVVVTVVGVHTGLCSWSASAPLGEAVGSTLPVVHVVVLVGSTLPLVQVVEGLGGAVG
jgi:uncharacterized membrane protein